MKKFLALAILLIIPVAVCSQSIGGYYGPASSVVFYDTFTGDGALASHTPNITPSGGWTGVGGTWSISSGRAHQDTNNATKIAYVDCGIPDYRVTVMALTGNGDTNIGFIFRIVDSNNYFALYVDNITEMRIYQFTDGTPTERADSNTHISVNTDSLLVATANGNTITFTLGAGTATYPSASQGNTSTLLGLSGYRTNDTFDTFTVTRY
jgi:hypothetical protein